MGFGEVRFWPDRPNKIQSAEHHPIPGYLLANGVESNGRVLALVYPGEPDLEATDGDRVFVDEARLEASVNAEQVRGGLAYAELYATMPLALIHRMRELAAAARADKAGMWPFEDLTTASQVQLGSVTELSTLVMFPKLYRRLVAYFKDGHTDLAGFDSWMRAEPVRRDDRVLLPTGELGNMHDLYHVDSDGITLQHLPEDLTFDPDPTVVPVRP